MVLDEYCCPLSITALRLGLELNHERPTASPLARHFEVFIEDQIAQLKYNDASEVIEAGLRLLEEREAKLDGLNRALQEGIDSGDAGPLDIEQILREAREEWNAAPADG